MIFRLRKKKEISLGDIFTIESKFDPMHGSYYRFRGLLNGAEGSWCSKKETAVSQGISHAKLICKINKIKAKGVWDDTV